MTANELIKHFNESFSGNAWPKLYHVDSTTYGNCCQAVFNNLVEHYQLSDIQTSEGILYVISLGINNGLIFKGVELIIKYE